MRKFTLNQIFIQVVAIAAILILLTIVIR
ncbi:MULTISPECIES: magnesium transporter protection protein MgtU [Pantoea]